MRRRKGCGLLNKFMMERKRKINMRESAEVASAGKMEGGREKWKKEFKG